MKFTVAVLSAFSAAVSAAGASTPTRPIDAAFTTTATTAAITKCLINRIGAAGFGRVMPQSSGSGSALGVSHDVAIATDPDRAPLVIEIADTGAARTVTARYRFPFDNALARLVVEDQSKQCMPKATITAVFVPPLPPAVPVVSEAIATNFGVAGLAADDRSVAQASIASCGDHDWCREYFVSRRDRLALAYRSGGEKARQYVRTALIESTSIKGTDWEKAYNRYSALSHVFVDNSRSASNGSSITCRTSWQYYHSRYGGSGTSTTRCD